MKHRVNGLELTCELDNGMTAKITHGLLRLFHGLSRFLFHRLDRFRLLRLRLRLRLDRLGLLRLDRLTLRTLRLRRDGIDERPIRRVNKAKHRLDLGRVRVEHANRLDLTARKIT